MARSWRINPLAFTPLPVTIISTLVYCAVFVSLLIVHHTVPAAPSSASPIPGINITEAWLDLKSLTNGFHPYNSRRNDLVRNWLLQRLDQILEANNASYVTEAGTGLSNPLISNASVVIFNDLQSNLSFSGPGRPTVEGTVTTYFEGTNIIVYIRGSEDSPDAWHASQGSSGSSGVLVNAHYDSVSTGYGATDDGVGVISVLQLVKYFSYPGHQPKKGVVALLNNGEEDYLNGARVFARHPISSFPHVFLNLEGAGAGGKALMFRSTDTEVTRFYKGAPYPYGSAMVQDGFKRRIIRSQTDYVVFDGDLGMRGLDVAFFAPRARYHTDQDDAKHTSMNSLWHMLSASVHTMYGLAMNSDSIFEGEAAGKGKVQSGVGTNAVWFDLFGRSFILFELHTLFAFLVTLMVVAPIALIAVGTVLSKVDRCYMFSLSAQTRDPSGDLKVSLGGLKGFFRFPIIFLFASAGVGGLAFLLAKVNPLIVYSSSHSVWSMMMSLWIFLAWFLSRAIDFVRPSAFHRSYALLWLFSGEWVLLVVYTVYEERLQIVSGHFLVFCFAAISCATLIAFCEQFGIEPKNTFAEKHSVQVENGRSAPHDTSQRDIDNDAQDDSTEVVTESTSLLRGSKRTTFANYSSGSGHEHGDAEDTTSLEDNTDQRYVYGHEQTWSNGLPSWTWLLQFLLLAPIPVIIVGQLGLLLTSAMCQTLADGNAALPVYILMAVFTVLAVTPLSPFLHRFTYHIPIFLLAVFGGTLIYNLMAFPFSGNNRLKVYFVQRVDLDTGINQVSLSGVAGPYLGDIVESLPSAAGQNIVVQPSRNIPDLIEHGWTGLAPRVVPNTRPGVPPPIGYQSWLTYNVTRSSNASSASIVLYGRNTRNCRLLFNSPISNYAVKGSDTDDRFPAITEGGTKQIRLWSREWDHAWSVAFSWQGDKGMDGKVVCLWNDEDGLGPIPALEEIRRFAPDWVAVSKAGDGLVEGSKVFAV